MKLWTAPVTRILLFIFISFYFYFAKAQRGARFLITVQHIKFLYPAKYTSLSSLLSFRVIEFSRVKRMRDEILYIQFYSDISPSPRSLAVPRDAPYWILAPLNNTRRTAFSKNSYKVCVISHQMNYNDASVDERTLDFPARSQPKRASYYRACAQEVDRGNSDRSIELGAFDYRFFVT